MKAPQSLIAACVVLSATAFAPAQVRPPATPPPADTGQMGEMVYFISTMEKYLYLVDHLTRMSENPTAAGVAAVLQASDLLKSRPQEAIDYFTRLLPEVKNESVKRAIRIQLADLYKNSNQNDKALDQLRELMIAAPPGPPRMRPAAEPPPNPR